MTPSDPIAGWQTYGARIEEPRYTGTRRYHPDDVRVWIAAILSATAFGICGVKVYASLKGLKEPCTLDQLFDPALSFLVGSLATILGFYFSDKGKTV